MVGLLAAGAAALLACSHLAVADPKVMKMELNRRPRDTILRKRDPQSVTLGNAEVNGLYYVNASVGTPPQVVQLQVDTGSADVWMFGSAAYKACGDECGGGSYSSGKSSTYNLLSKGSFSIEYETPGSGVVGDYFTDTFAIGGVKLQNLTMAVASQANQTTTGIMGIAFDTDESIVSNSNFTTKPYNNIIDVMVQQGVIETRAYSLYLDDLESDTGAILFGGYDTAKYTGDLTVLDIQVDAQTGKVDDFAVVWSLIAVTDSTGTTALQADFPMPAILDSGTTLTIVPQDMFDTLADYFGAQSTNEYGYIVSCADASVEGSVDYGFGGDGGPIISVPFSELALPLYDTNGDPVTFEDGSAACSFGFDVAQEGTPVLLGDTFLRSAYVVYDLDNKQIAIANSFWNATDSNIVAISNNTSGSAIASASSAVGVSVSQTATGNVVAPGVRTDGSETATGLAATPTYSAGASQISGAKTSLLGLGVHGVTSTAGAATPTSSKGGAHTIRAPVSGLPSLLVVAGTFAALLGGCLLTIIVM